MPPALDAGHVNDYLRRVRAVVIRFLLLLGVLLMPFGMTPVSASGGHHAISASMPMKDCPDQGSRHDGKSGIAECTMACAAALPAVMAQADDVPPAMPEPILPAVSQRLRGLHPDTATPPPKRG